MRKSNVFGKNTLFCDCGVILRWYDKAKKAGREKNGIRNHKGKDKNREDEEYDERIEKLFSGFGFVSSWAWRIQYDSLGGYIFGYASDCRQP